MVTSSFNLFIFFMLSGTIISLTSSYWMLMWIGMEITLIGLIPIVLSYSNSLEKEGIVKYFTMQALGSIFVLAGSLIMFYPSFSWETSILSFFSVSGAVTIVFGLFLKLGIFPVHFWVSGVICSMSWLSCLLILTWQKIAPLFFMIYLMQNFTFYLCMIVIFLSVISSMIGSLGGLNQTLLRGILAFSSITHTGWMGVSSCLGLSETYLYFTIYCLMSFSLFGLLMFMEIYSSNHSLLLWNLVTLNLFAMSGMPPFVGFISKWVVLKSMFLLNMPMILIILLIISSIISLYYYIKTIYSFILIEKKLKSVFWNMYSSLFSLLNIFGFCFFISF
uniref:NADH-ubiquinone oxidoreductase chain 2 n=1 Tax=Valvata hokkaidoensis TaxID=96458 RepID=A0A7R7T1Z0_9GAST|nr:ND2 [Valvata hokkaidoensis]